MFYSRVVCSFIELLGIHFIKSTNFFLPTGNKREFTYVSGNPCDPNNPDGSEEEERNQSEEDLDENVPQNYPKRPIPQRPRPTQPPTTARAPTTVFQNIYNQQGSEEEEDVPQYAQQPRTSPRPFVQSTPRPRVQVIDTTPDPSPVYASPTPSYATPSYSPTKTSINITPKPLYRIQNNALSFQQTQPAPTTYRPQTVSIVTPKPLHATTPSYITNQQQGVTFTSGSTRGAIDFDAEFKKFQHENSNGGFVPVTPSQASQATKSNKIPSGSAGVTSNPIYQTRLVYNPSSGQYDSDLYQHIAQTDSEFQLNQRIQPYAPQQQYQQQYQIPQQQTLYRPQPERAQVQIPQQVYQRQQNDQQFVNSQQLFAQQLQMQQSALHRDRIEAAKKQQSPNHRFQLQQAEPSPILQNQQRVQPGQQFYYLQPSAQQQGSGGQIDAFLRGHNLEY